MKLLCSFLAVFMLQGPLFAAEEQSIYIYPLAEDSTRRLIYTAQLFDSLQKIYEPDLKKKETQLFWDFHWDQNYVGAGSNYILEKKQFKVLLLGGQVRATSSNFEVLAAVLCHEIGHFLGGAPKQVFALGVEHWSSAEGQSDWFAASQCLPKVFDLFKVTHPEFLTFHNEESTEILCLNSKDKRKCQWILGAAESLAKHFDEVYEHKKNQPSLFKKDPEIVQETSHTKYPSIQCRLDTMKEAAFCADRTCERPTCWFKKNWNFSCIVNCSGF